MYIQLNPAYSLRNEPKCSYIAKKEGILNRDTADSCVVPIPPYIGYILSHIGDAPYELSCRTLAQNLGVTPQSIDNFVQQLANKDNNLEFYLSADVSVVFPKKLLLRSEKAIYSQRILTSNDFDKFDNFEIKRPNMPFSVNLMITTKCNTNCVYCYAKRSLKESIRLDKIISILDELYQEGVLNITITGGDIFAYNNWIDVLSKLTYLGYKPFLSTKTCLKESEIKKLHELGYSELQFSLDSCDTNVLCEMISSDSNYLQNVRTMFDLCDKYNIQILIRTVLTSVNSKIEQIREFYEFLAKFKCVKEWIMTPAFFSESKKKTYEIYEVPNENLKNIYNFTHSAGLCFNVGLNKINQDGYTLKKFRSVDDFVCGNQICLANTTSMSVLANGLCSICEMLYDHEEYIIGDINLNTIKEIWNSDKAINLYTLKAENFSHLSKCKNCTVFSKCRNSFGKRICYSDVAKTGGSLESPDPRCPQANNVNIIL